MSKNFSIAIDVMGGDHGPCQTVLGCVDILAQTNDRNFKLLLIGDEKEIFRQLDLFSKEYLKKNNISPDSSDSRMQILHTDNYIKMDESPSVALKRGKGTSLWLSIEAVKKGECKAAVSAGNTGAMMAISKYLLIRGINILFYLPNS